MCPTVMSMFVISSDQTDDMVVILSKPVILPPDDLLRQWTAKQSNQETD